MTGVCPTADDGLQTVGNIPLVYQEIAAVEEGGYGAAKKQRTHDAVDNEAKTFDLDAEGVILVFELSAIRQVVKAAPAVAEAPKAETATDEIVDTTADVVADEKSDDAK